VHRNGKISNNIRNPSLVSVQDVPARLSVDTLTAEAAEQDLASLFVPSFFVETFNVLSYTVCSLFAELCCRLVVNQVMPWIKLLNEHMSLQPLLSALKPAFASLHLTTSPVLTSLSTEQQSSSTA
jgi:hypothetical protein